MVRVSFAALLYFVIQSSLFGVVTQRAVIGSFELCVLPREISERSERNRTRLM